VDELTRSNQELNGVRSRLTIENTELSRQLQEIDAGFGNASRSRLQLQQALDEAKNKLDEESKVHVAFIWFSIYFLSVFMLILLAFCIIFMFDYREVGPIMNYFLSTIDQSNFTE